jgi:hypothetical protein
MAFANPFSITINSIAYALNRINADNFGSDWVYRDAAFQLSMSIRHSTDAPVKISGVINYRHNVKLTKRVFSTSTTKEFIRTWTMTVVCPDYDDPAVALLDLVGISAAVATSTHYTDLLAGLN